MSSRYDVIGPDTLHAMRRDGELARLKDRIEQLEAALREIASLSIICASDIAVVALRRTALEGEKDD